MFLSHFFFTLSPLSLSLSPSGPPNHPSTISLVVIRCHVDYDCATGSTGALASASARLAHCHRAQRTPRRHPITRFVEIVEMVGERHDLLCSKESTSRIQRMSSMRRYRVFPAIRLLIFHTHIFSTLFFIGSYSFLVHVAVNFVKEIKLVSPVSLDMSILLTRFKSFR